MRTPQVIFLFKTFYICPSRCRKLFRGGKSLEVVVGGGGGGGGRGGGGGGGVIMVVMLDVLQPA